MTTSIITTYFGLDVSKATLDLAGPGIKSQTMPNTPKGITQLIATLQALMPSASPCVVCEPTGGYEREAIQALLQAGIRVARIHPQRVRLFAKSMGQLAKTDRMDAALLAEFGKKSNPREMAPSDRSLEQLRVLFDRRQQLVLFQTTESNHLESALPSMRAHIKKSLAFFAKQIAEMEKLIDAHIATHSEIAKKIQRLEEVKGVGRVSATVLLAHMPELGTINDKQAAALAGLAPYNSDSGTVQGRRCIRGGRHEVRRILYMAAVAAARFNPILRAFYQRLREKGKPGKLALTAVMRKLLVLLNRMLKNPNFSIAT